MGGHLARVARGIAFLFADACQRVCYLCRDPRISSSDLIWVIEAAGEADKPCRSAAQTIRDSLPR
jgi:hypothetical protein